MPDLNHDTDKALKKSVSIPASLVAWGKKRAQKYNLPGGFSGYLQALIELDQIDPKEMHLHKRDSRWHLFEERAGYGEELDEPTDPPNPSQHPGAGPAAEVPA